MSEPPGLALTASLDGPADAPVLVLGNSLGTSRAVWAPQLPALARHFRLLRFELPGHGEPAGPAPAGPYSIGDIGRAVLALLDRHGIGRACYAGISIGGMTGLWLAAHAPARIAALGLCCTSAYLPPAVAWRDRAALVRAAGMAPITGPALSRWFTPAFARADPAAVAGIAAMLAGTAPEGYAGCCEAIAAMDLRPVLGPVIAPTLVIAASEDPATPPAHGAQIARAIAGARLRVVRGAAHLANIQAPGPVTGALLDHLTASVSP
ncbi:MAG TPA: 3-oxoadipate enol-lactonase [Streptosporangiaceae bacterium]|jgi:3-oxoadipate enol-lactonase